MVDKVRADSNGRDGILASGTVSHNTATGNGNDGIRASGTVSHNSTISNNRYGIVGGAGTVNHNTATFNGAFGLNLSSQTGYAGNVMSGNATGAVSGGVSLGGGNHNLCNGVPC